MGNREKFLEHYHQRSGLETAYSMMKAKFGDSLRSKSHVGQIYEALCKVLCHFFVRVATSDARARRRTDF